MAPGEKQESIAGKLAGFVHALTYESLPEDMRDLAKNRILDALSCAYAGRNLPHSRTAVEIAKNSPGNCTVIGHPIKTALLDGVMANSVLAHSILQEDTAFMGHPGTMMVPVALAVGEQEKASGKEGLAAIVAGYELMGRISMGVYPMAMSAFRPGPIMGTFGAAATAGKLMKLDVEKLTHGLGYAASLAPGLPNEGWWGGTMEPMFEAGVCARIGVLSAGLARGGATAAPRVLDGRHGFLRCWAGNTEKAALITEGLGKTYLMSQVVVKPFPACGINQLPIQAALPLAKLGLRAKDISRIVEKTRPGGTSYAGSDFPGPFDSQFQAQMSMQFCAAATILGRPVDSLSFYAEHYEDPEVAELAKKVELLCEEGRVKPRFEVYTRDGRVFTAEEETVDQAPRTPSREGMEQKFRRLATDFLGEQRVDQIIELVMNLEKLADLRELTAELSVYGK
ncbi:MAG: MmgE/PrpD family protein [Proteobacteria bacterium]|nr:MmgE/PrpD family protein [Pseudomonadota bacterium]